MTTLTVVAASQNIDLIISLHSLYSLLFGLVFFSCLYQIVRLWSHGSKLSTRKQVFITISILCLARMIWYSHEWKMSYIDKIWEYVYYLPMLLMFTANSFLILNWFQLYQKEKLRKKLPLLSDQVQHSQTPLERNKKSERRIAELVRLHQIMNIVLYVLMIFSLKFISVPPEIPISIVSLIFIIIGSLYTFRMQSHLGRARKSDSWKLKKHTLFTFSHIFSVFTYFLIFLPLTCWSLFGYNVQTQLQWLYQAVHFYEIFHCALSIILLGSDSLSLRAPFPSKTNNITQDWLTGVLQENGIIKSTTMVIGFWLENLKGGCHYKVVRVNLRYSSDITDVKNNIVGMENLVIKILYWDKSIYERIILYLHFLLETKLQDVTNLKSYHIESLFYKNIQHEGTNFQIKGLKTPQVYYNFGDCFNNRFGMIQQDLTSLEDAQPNGFPIEDAKVCMSRLAEFHACNWGIQKSSNIVGWDTAAYWTGERECKKEKVGQAWLHAVANFPELKFDERYPQLGKRLLSRLNWIKEEFKTLLLPQYRTLCHGDYKISNLFINRIKLTSSQKQREYSSNSYPPNSVFAIDWQWFGYGNCCIDVVSFLNTSIKADYLKNYEQLLQLYYKTLVSQLGGAEYPFDLFKHHYQICLVDFCMFCIVSKWSKSTPEEFIYMQQKQKDGLHLRSIEHMLFILDQCHEFLNQWEESDDSNNHEQCS